MAKSVMPIRRDALGFAGEIRFIKDLHHGENALEARRPGLSALTNQVFDCGGDYDDLTVLFLLYMREEFDQR